jgi:uncharacterized membrane protein YphA (DoxX/SURF4 family)
MKWYDHFSRFFVGVLFIFSGLTKLDDPVGTAIKLKEYFEVFAGSFSKLFNVFIPYDLPIAIFLIVFEVMLGIALLFNYRMKLTTLLLLLLSVFFTFLTFYSAYFNKVTDCGCFGDAIPLTAWESFYKDVILLFFAVFLFTRRMHFKAWRNKITRTDGIMIGLVGFNIFAAVYTVYHLPLIDFMPYKIGNNIAALMKPSAPFHYRYIMEKEGREYKFDQYPSDTTLTFKKMVLLNPEAQPKITDYHVWNDDGDYTQETFQGNKLFVIMYNVDKANVKHFNEINQLAESLKGIAETWILSASEKSEIEDLRNQYNLNIPYYYTDMTVLEAVIRSNPGLWLLKDGVVAGKWPYSNLPDANEVTNLLQQAGN